MEWALAIPHLQALEKLHNPWSGCDESYLTGLKAIIEEKYGPIIFTRLYFGEEFCEKALLSNQDLEKAVGAAAENGMEFTYITPYVTETGLSKIKALLTRLAQIKPEAEVVINDWGTLDWVTRRQQTLTPVLGRLMNKIIRDPRIPINLRAASAEATIHRFQTCSLAGTGMQGLLERYKVRRVELDYPPQGLDPELPSWGYDVSLYLPFGVVTTGRICLMQSWGLKPEEKFKTSGECSQKCKLYWLEMSDRSGRVRRNKDWQIMQKGNTVFYRQNRGFAARILQGAEKTGVNRIVFQPEPI